MFPGGPSRLAPFRVSVDDARSRGNISQLTTPAGSLGWRPSLCKHPVPRWSKKRLPTRNTVDTGVSAESSPYFKSKGCEHAFVLELWGHRGPLME